MRSLSNDSCARPIRASLFLAVCCCASQLLLATPAVAPAVTSLSGLPLFFEPSGRGSVKSFIARGQNCQVFLEAASAQIILARPEGPRSLPHAREDLLSGRSVRVRTVRMELVGADREALMSASQPYLGKINELSGNASHWQTEISTSARVHAASVYPGIDVVYYGNEQRLEYDFNLSPGAEPSVITLKFTGVDSLKIDAHGDLVLTAGDDLVRQHRPVVYQVIDGRRRDVESSYELRGDRMVGFRIGQFRRDLPLTIDPVLSYASYFGGSSGDSALAIRLGPDQSIYVAGQTLSRSFLFAIPADGFQRTFSGGKVNGDAFVARFDSTGTNLLYFTYLGGEAEDGALDLAVDSTGNAFVTGFTTSSNFPVQNALASTIQNPKDPALGTYPKDGFVAVLNPAGSGLLYSTYLGGRGSDVGIGIAVDSLGAACVTGTTDSTNFPTWNPLPEGNLRSGGIDAFVARLAPGGQSFVFSTYFGGSRLDQGQGIAYDPQGAIYVTGYSASGDLPITNAFQAGINVTTNASGALDAFVAKFSSAGALLYSTYLGGKADDAGYRVAVDSDGEAYVTGYTYSSTFPNTVTNVAGLTNKVPSTSNSEAFLAKIGVDPAGTSVLRYSTLMGGSSADSGWDVAVTPGGDAYVVGVTSSRNFPTNNTSGFLRHTNSGRADVFILGLAADTSHLLFSGYLGGSLDDFGYGIVLSPASEAYVTGRTLSANFPPLNSFQSVRSGTDDAFIAVISPDPVLQVSAVEGGFDVRWWGGIGPEYSLEQAASPDQAGWSPVSEPVTTEAAWRSVRVPSSDGISFFRLKRD